MELKPGPPVIDVLLQDVNHRNHRRLERGRFERHKVLFRDLLFLLKIDEQLKMLSMKFMYVELATFPLMRNLPLIDIYVIFRIEAMYLFHSDFRECFNIVSLEYCQMIKKLRKP